MAQHLPSKKLKYVRDVYEQLALFVSQILRVRPVELILARRLWWLVLNYQIM